jgi:peptidoglycan-associated lipoprotein
LEYWSIGKISFSLYTITPSLHHSIPEEGFLVKVFRRYRKNTRFILVLIAVLIFSVSCASQKPVQSGRPQVQTEPTVIELSDESRLSDVLKEGDIPEEDRSQLSWLPNRPPLGMQFEETSELQTVYFEFDKYSLTAQARDSLNTNAEWLRKHPEVSVQIEGHCDERGTLEYNQVLGENRAISTKKYLVTLGIDPDRLYTISYGETMPADPGHDEDAWAKNRRAQFKIAR